MFDLFDFSHRNNTPLSPLQEAAFQLSPMARDVRDYDARGAWLEMQLGLLNRAANGHYPDKYKKPNHPTFSTQSIYSGRDGYYGGVWQGSPETGWVFYPNVTNFYSPPALREYWNKAEPGNDLRDTGVRW